MPDAHKGFGMPIGGVLATVDTVIPNAVGVDIGCGMIAVQTDLQDCSLKELQKAVRRIRKEIPAGFSHHKKKQHWKGFDAAPEVPTVQRELESARYQLGTLGGGNHFIEVQRGDDGYIWLMLHSGSRNFGYTIAREFSDIAKNEAKKNHLQFPDMQLAPLSIDTAHPSPAATTDPRVQAAKGKSYFEAMEFAQQFASESRTRMMDTVISVMHDHFGPFSSTDRIHIHHNFARIETHYGQRVVVHRKGATSAELGQRGIIPGSQGSPSYIVEGLGNPESFHSCSHGAGRLMGRKEAQRKLNLADEQSRLDRLGIFHNLHSKKDLDEAMGAYKNIDEVMDQQRDLVRPLVKLLPLAVIKG
ncbi:MAG: RtcB family protein, partial [Spirochaetia bacterium]|nr:RtcB family protein [Spirochaetia bacterium]